MRNILFLFVGLFFLGCSEYLDINEDPNRLRDVQLSSLLPNVAERTSNNYYSASITTSQACYQIGSYFQHFQEFTLAGTWSGTYLSGLKNGEDLVNRAEAENSPYYAGVGRVLMAVNLGLITDCWEDAPFSDALGGTANVTPVFDSQEQLYGSIMELLDQAIVDLQAETSVFSPGSDDLIYGGDIDKWLRAAHAFKARYALHTLNKASTSASDVLSAVDQAFTSNDDDFQLVYNAIRRNPYHTDIALGNNTGNFTVTHSNYFIDLLKEGFTDTLDPRLPLLADPGLSSEFVGITDYDDAADPNTVDFSESTWHSTEQAPVVMCSYSELKFIEAEAAMDSDPGRAYGAYLEGIRANMEKVGVAEADIAAYLADPNIAVGAGNLTMGLILRQKYVTLFLNPEAWVDMRRVDFNNSAASGYAGLFIPTGGQFVDPAQRAEYPIEEVSRNGAEVSKVAKDFNEPMWRDQ
jgi:hypothetical protein